MTRPLDDWQRKQRARAWLDEGEKPPRTWGDVWSALPPWLGGEPEMMRRAREYGAAGL